MEGTGWTTVDIKGTWRPDGPRGAHPERRRPLRPLQTDQPGPTTPRIGSPAATAACPPTPGANRNPGIVAAGCLALRPRFKATLGARYEHWRAFDGFNFTSATAIVQPGRDKTALSPKASLSWEATTDCRSPHPWAGRCASRTVGELYQTIQVGAIFQSANPNLKPEDVVSAELSFEKALDQGKLRISLFAEQVKDALIAQTANFPASPPHIVHAERRQDPPARHRTVTRPRTC